MRLLLAAAASSMVACASGHPVLQTETHEQSRVVDRSSTNPEGTSTSSTLSFGTPPPPTSHLRSGALEADQGLALRDGAYWAVRPGAIAGTVQSLSDPSLQWSAPLLHVRAFRPQDAKVGAEVFFNPGTKTHPAQALSAPWTQGKIESVDGVFGQVKIAGRVLDGATELLLPAP